MSGRYGALWTLLAFLLLGLVACAVALAPEAGAVVPPRPRSRECPAGCPRDCGCDGGSDCYCRGATGLDRYLRTLE